MKCKSAMDTIYHYSGEAMPLLEQVQVAIHLFFCSACTKKSELLDASNEVLSNDFFPESPDLEDSIMNMISAEENSIQKLQETEALVPGELSTRGWIIAGLIILVSLASLFFGLEFNQLAYSAGISYLLPVGITIGIVLTTYGALFIGSHLKELSKRFKL